LYDHGSSGPFTKITDLAPAPTVFGHVRHRYLWTISWS
jgi:hypothetical protein